MTEPPRRRRTLTPFESELRFWEPPGESRPGPLRRFRRHRRERQPATTTLGAIAVGLLHLAVAVAVGSGAALLLDHLAGRSTEFGFYVVGGFVLLGGASIASRSILVAGFVLLAIAVAIDVLTH